MRLASNIRTFLLALVLATAVWVSAVTAANPDEVQPYPQSIPIEIVGQDPSLIITNELPTNVEVTIRAPRSVWAELTTRDNAVRAILDLTGLGAGEHNVDIQIQVAVRPTQIVFSNPKTVTVDLDNLIQKTLPLIPSLNGQPAAGYQAGKASLATKEVVISGPASLVKKAVRARVMINLDGVREDINEPVDIQITDASNEVLRGLTLNPETVQANIPISQQGGFSDLAVKVIVRGQIAAGYRLENISVYPQVVTVLGNNPAVVSALQGVVETEPLDLQDAKEDISTRLALNLPSGVTLVGAQTVQVQVSITPIQTNLTLLNLHVNVIGLENGLSAQVFPQAVDIIFSGPLPVLEALKPEDVTITVNVAGLGVGSHQLKPEVKNLLEDVTVGSILPSTVEVVISVAGTPTPTPFPTRSP